MLGDLVAKRAKWYCCVAVISSMLVSACSLLNPHVKPDNADWKVTQDLKDPFAGDLVQAIDYANAWRWKYYEAVGNDSYLRSGLALTLVPMGATALFLGATSASSANAIAGLSFGGAALYGVGTYLQSTPRQRVYLSGSTAIGCALLAVRPLLIKQSFLSSLEVSLSALEAQTTLFSNQIANVEAKASVVRARDPNDTTLKDAQVVITNAHTLLDQARATYQSGIQFRNSVLQAGYELHVVVDNIRDTVSTQITNTEPDLTAILGIVTGLQKGAAQFHAPATTTSPAKAPTTPGPEAALLSDADELKQAAAALQNSFPAFTAAINAVANKLQDVGVAGGKDSFADILACKVAQPVNTFQVTPEDDTQTLPAGGNIAFAVTGGTGIPRAAITGNVVTGVTLDSDSRTGTFIATLSALSSTPGGQTTLVFTDATGNNRKVVRVTVGAGAGPKPVEPAPTTTLGEPTEWEKNSTTADHETVQRALNKIGTSKATIGKDLAVDGVIGSDTRKVIGAYQSSKGETVTNNVSPKLFLELKAFDGAQPQPPAAPVPSKPGPAQPAPPPPHAAGTCPVGPQSEFESSLKPADIVDIQTGLNIAPAKRTGQLDAATRVEIRRAWARLQPSDQPKDTCLLTAELVKRIKNG